MINLAKLLDVLSEDARISVARAGHGNTAYVGAPGHVPFWLARLPIEAVDECDGRLCITVGER